MGSLAGAVGEGIGTVLGYPIVQIGLRAGLAYLALLWLAAGYWVYRDLARRSPHALT